MSIGNAYAEVSHTQHAAPRWIERGIPHGRANPARTLNLALQGGGAHGAYTWGVLDRLLEEPGIDLDGISGASAGAVNTVALASGWISGGREGARKSLNRLWTTIGDMSLINPMRQTILHRMTGFTSAQIALESLARAFSPYQMNPLGLNPLRHILLDTVDFESIRKTTDLQLFISATNVKTGRARIFTTGELTVDVILASACLPNINQAITIDGEDYWDGGLSANPPIIPLIRKCETADTLLVQISPFESTRTPMTARDIRNRLVDMLFNTPLHQELKAFEMALELSQDLDEENPVQASGLHRRLRDLRLHEINAGSSVQYLDPRTKGHPDLYTLEYLFRAGRSSTSSWLAGAG